MMMMDAVLYKRISRRTYLCIAAGMVAVFALALYGMGQVAICKCGYVKLWHGVVSSSENSQHIADWYTFSHVIHGFAFYGILWLAWRKSGRVRAGGSEEKKQLIWLWFLIALAAETSWELFENTDFIINRYREVTISLDYFGDSVVNSVSDVLFMALGFYLASRLPVWAAVGLVILLEVFVGYWIRDNLTLNIIMLVYPLEGIRIWQGGG